MLRRIFTVGGFTLLSRVTGFARDIMLAAILGAGPIADAFFVALRLPNHFRAIFAEGAFNAAFVPAYARVREQEGRGSRAKSFLEPDFHDAGGGGDWCLSRLAMIFTPTVISLLAPGFSDDPGRFALASELTRITFPYLLLVSLVTVYGGILNTLGYFASPAAAPILLNLSMMMTLALAAFFPTAGHAAAWGVLLAGFWRPCWSARMRRGAACCRPSPSSSSMTTPERFFKALGPATLGSAGTQIALFADTIIASFLTAGALSALYYADRLNQLPIGVIGIAVGTVLLPEMANRIARGDTGRATCAEPRDRTDAVVVGALSCRVHAGAGPDHARAVCARRVHRGRCCGLGRDAGSLCGRAVAVCPVAQRHRRRFSRAAIRQRRSRRCLRPSPSTSRSRLSLMGSLCAGRPRARDFGRASGSIFCCCCGSRSAPD